MSGNANNTSSCLSDKKLHFLHGFAWVMLLAGIAAILLIIGAMYCYAEQYNLWGDFLSAMGRTSIHGNKYDNLTGCLVFNTGLTIAGICTGTYFVLRGLHGKKLIGIPLILFGSVGGFLLMTTGLIPFDVWPDGHNYSIYIAAGLLAACLVLCGLQGNSLFGSRENNISWLFMSLFVGICWLGLQDISKHGFLQHCGVIQQKLMVFYFWFFMIRHVILLLFATRSRKNGK